MFLAGSILGGIAGAAGASLTARPAPAPATPAATSAPSTTVAPATASDPSALVAAVSEVLPAVVTVVNRGTTGSENTLVVRGSGEEGLGFAISSATVKGIASQLIARGSAR